MKTALLVSLLAVGLGELNGMLDSLNAWVELGVKVFGLAAAIGGAWRWLLGPGYRRARSTVCWVGEQLEMIGTLNDRLKGMQTQLDRGAEHFERLDATLEAMASDEARAVRRSIHSGEPVVFTEAGGVERREPVSDTRA